MKKFLIILISIIFAAPLSSLLSHLFLSLMMDDNYNFVSVLFVAYYEVPIYIIVGIPVTLLIDLVLKLPVVSNTKKLYFFQFLLYSLAAAFFGLYGYSSANEYSTNVELVILEVIAIYTYFHILYFLRKRLNKE